MARREASKSKKHSNKGFIIERADGRKLNVGGYQYAEPEFKFASFAPTRYSASQLPKKVDLRPYMTTVEDQGQVNSCTANAVAGAYEYLVKKNQGIDYDVSRLFIYYNARRARGEQDRDEGSVISTAIKMLEKKGACSEETWPYEPRHVKEKPSKACYDEAQGFRIDGTQHIDTDLNVWRSALAEGNPIVFGIALFDSFDRQRRRGFVPEPSNQESKRGSHGNHAMLCVGYSDPDQVFIVRNSWGDNWGDNGYCYIPYRYMMNPSYNHGDSWIIHNASEVPTPEDAWIDDDESVLTDLNDEFSDMDDETWAAFNDEMGDYDLPHRLGALFAIASGMDEDYSDEEIKASVKYLRKILKMFDYDMKPLRVLENCTELLEIDGFIEETVDILGRYLSPGALGRIAADMYRVAGADGLDPEEEEFIDSLVGAWLDDECKDDEEDDEEDDDAYSYDDEEDDDEEDEYEDWDEDEDDEEDDDEEEDDDDWSESDDEDDWDDDDDWSESDEEDDDWDEDEEDDEDEDEDWDEEDDEDWDEDEDDEDDDW